MRKWALALVALLPTPALAADASGTWTISGPVTPQCALKQTGALIIGGCKGANAEGPVTGTVDGDTVKWTYHWVAYADKNSGSFDFSGTLGADSISGSVIVNGAASPFTAKRTGPAPDATAAAGINRMPPKSVWQVDTDGTAFHQQSGLNCPQRSAEFLRNEVTMYDKVGFDVSCNYRIATADVTLYLTRRAPNALTTDFEGAKQALVQTTPTATPRDGALAAPTGFQWLQASYDEQGGAVRSDILFAALSGWEYEIRATYRVADIAAVTAAIAELSAKTADSAGRHLADCAANAPPARAGQAIAKNSLLPHVIVAAAQALDLTQQRDTANWCPDTVLTSSTDAIIYWHNIAAVEHGPVDRITHIAPVPDLLVLKEAPGSAGPPEANGVYDVVLSAENSLSLVGVFSGRPPLNALTPFLGPHGVLADIAKATRKVTLYANAVDPP
jgi:hypothetical protein